MNLPPLRTVREATAPPTPEPGPTPAVRPVRPIAGIDHPRLPPVGKAFLTELVENRLIESGWVAGFLAKVGDRVPHLNSRERTGDALVAQGLLTRYQRDRALAAQYHGLTFGPYRVLERLGGGSIGLVFLAEHGFLKRRVAVKVLPAEDTTPAAIRERFEVEARMLAGLRHPHVIEIYDAGLLPGEPGLPPLYYAVLELAPGGDVENYVYAHGAQPVPVVCEWGRQAASGLRAIHDAGLVHRDLKPSNLVLTATRRIKLVDFGLAREYASTRTPHRVVLGSLDFLAPEQLADAATAGPPADLFSLGVSLFWLLTGQLPRPALRTAAAALEASKSGVTKRLREFLPDVPEELDAFFARLTAKNPADRPTAAEAVATFAAFAEPPADPEAVADRHRAAVEQLENAVRAKEVDANSARVAVMALLVAVADPTGEAAENRKRVGEIVRLLAGQLATDPNWAMLADPAFVESLVSASALHALGQTGCALLDALNREHAVALPFLRIVRDVVQHHGERWDGSGFPGGLAKDNIPPAARLTAVAAAYEKLRGGTVDRTRAEVVSAASGIRTESGTAFDPAVVRAFEQSATKIEALYPQPVEPEPASSPAERQARR